MRALLLVLDSVGIGNAPDAAEYEDAGANTLGHILAKNPELDLPALSSLGLPEVLGEFYPTTNAEARYRASYGRMRARSAGKDTTTGHWEIAGAILEKAFSVYERFPDELVRAIEHEANVKFIGNVPSSGTTILEKLGAEHLQTGHPILYTSADSVLQIAAHEEAFGVEHLYDVCRIARRQANPFRIGRVIARPFTGQEGNFSRTARRHDFSMKPPPTILDALSERKLPVIGVGKISDIFAGQGVTESFPTTDNADGMARIEKVWGALGEGLVFANLVDFDMLHGHRRDVRGYAAALENFDCWLEKFIGKVSPDDFMIITADHGNDPTHRGTDHTREQVPLFVLHEGKSKNLGQRETFADVAATLADLFKLPEAWPVGCSFL